MLIALSIFISIVSYLAIGFLLATVFEWFDSRWGDNDWDATLTSITVFCWPLVVLLLCCFSLVYGARGLAKRLPSGEKDDVDDE